VTTLPARELDAERLQAEVLGVGGDSDGDDADVGGERLGLAADLQLQRDPLVRLGELGHLHADAELDASLFEGLAGGGGDLLVLDGQMRSSASTTVTSVPRAR
jgi:hypothetical protein